MVKNNSNDDNKHGLENAEHLELGRKDKNAKKNLF